MLEIVLVIMDSDASATDISEAGEQINFSLWRSSRAISRYSNIPNSSVVREDKFKHLPRSNAAHFHLFQTYNPANGVEKNPLD